MISRMSVGISESESSPCAIVVPPGDSRAARSVSTWIHCSSPVASANLLMRSWVISIQSLMPTSVSTAPLRSLKSLNTRISLLLWSDSQTSQESNCHFRHRGRDDKFGLSIGDHVRDVDARCRFRQRVAYSYRRFFRESTFD